MGHMAVGLMVDTGQKEMTQLGMAGSWIHRTEEVMDTDFILALLIGDIIAITATIIIGGVRRSI